VLGTCYSSSPEALEAIDFVRCEALAGVRGRSPREKNEVLCPIESVSVSKTPTPDALEATGFVALAGVVNVLSCFYFCCVSPVV
jgi:hypothetical protein